MNTNLVRAFAGVAGLLALLGGVGACERAGDGGSAPPEAAAAADPALYAPYVERFRALRARDQPAEGANFVALLEAADAELTALSERFGAKIVRVDGSVVHVIDFDAVMATGDWQGERPLEEEQKAVRAALAAMGEAGGWDRISAMVRAPRYERAVAVGPLVDTQLPQLAAVRRMARLLRAGMREAAADGDWATATARIGDLLALSRQAAREPVILARLVGHAVEAVAFGEVRLLAARADIDESALAALAAALEEHRLPPIDAAAEGELLLFESAAADVYTNGPAGIQRLMGGPGGAGTPLPAGGLGDGLPGRAADEEAARALYGSLAAVARLPRAKRAAEAPEVYRKASESKSLMIGLLWPAVDRSLLSSDQAAAEHVGARVIVALERHKRANGAYPESLAALVPAQLGSAPTDPYTGGALGYLPPARGPFEGGRAYVLYAAGPDGTDDGGKVNFGNRFMMLTDGEPIPGVDFLLNAE